MTSYGHAPLDRRWTKNFLAHHPHHIQNSLEWFDFIRSYSGELDRSAILLCDNQPVGFVMALQHKNLIQSLPYPASYGGIVFEPSISAIDKRNLLSYLFKFYSTDADVFSICGSPLIDNQSSLRDHFDFKSDFTVHVIDLKQELLNGTSSKFRNNLKRNLRKAADAGILIREDTSNESFRLWHRCYNKRISELRGNSLDYEFFESMRDHLKQGGSFKLFNATQGANYLGGILVVHNQFCADYYLSMFDRDSDDTQAGTATLYYALQWAKSQGIEYFNMQSSPKSQPALAEFKRSWGATETTHSYYVKILKNKETLIHLSPDTISKEYRYHYLLPFSAMAQQLELSHT